MISVGDIVTLRNCSPSLVGAMAEVTAVPRVKLQRYQILVNKRVAWARRGQLRAPEPVVSWDECCWQPEEIK